MTATELNTPRNLIARAIVYIEHEFVHPEGMIEINGGQWEEGLQECADRTWIGAGSLRGPEAFRTYRLADAAIASTPGLLAWAERIAP